MADAGPTGMTRRKTTGRTPRGRRTARPRKAGGRSAPPVASPASQVPSPDAIHPGNTLNDLTGAEWLFFTRSALTTAYPHRHGHDLRKAHGANKPPAMMAEIIRFFTKPGGLVLDPFAGVGGTLLGAALAGRRAVGVELNPRWIAVYREVCRREGIAEFPVLAGDCRAALADWARVAPPGCAAVDFVCTDPPYNLNFKRTMCGLDPHRYRRTDYEGFSDEAADLSNAADYPAFVAGMAEALRLSAGVLKAGGYAAVMVRDAYQGGRYVLVHADLARAAEPAGLVLKGVKVWYQAGTRLRPYGYPKSYIPNIAHQHILIFRKEPTDRRRDVSVTDVAP
jgi:DNA modification methylase